MLDGLCQVGLDVDCMLLTAVEVGALLPLGRSVGLRSIFKVI